MLVGILSDTHDEEEMTMKALAQFRRRGADLLIHAGDIMSAEMLRLFKDFPARFVLGNEDKDVAGLNEESLRLGFGPIERQTVFEAGGKSFLMLHGESSDVPLFRRAVASGEYNYIVKGHTHSFENYIAANNKSRVINPGALYHAYEFTVALLDTERDNVEMIEIA